MVLIGRGTTEILEGTSGSYVSSTGRFVGELRRL